MPFMPAHLLEPPSKPGGTGPGRRRQPREARLESRPRLAAPARREARRRNPRPAALAAQSAWGDIAVTHDPRAPLPTPRATPRLAPAAALLLTLAWGGAATAHRAPQDAILVLEPTAPGRWLASGRGVALQVDLASVGATPVIRFRFVGPGGQPVAGPQTRRAYLETGRGPTVAVTPAGVGWVAQASFAVLADARLVLEEADHTHAFRLNLHLAEPVAGAPVPVPDAPRRSPDGGAS